MPLYKKALVLTSSFVLCFTYLSSAQNNSNLTLTGHLTDSVGNAVGGIDPVSLDVSVKLFDDSTGGNLWYSESFLSADSMGVSVEDGLMAIHLGSGTSEDNLPEVIGAHNDLWVEITVDGDILSRTPLSGAPYAVSSDKNSYNVSVRTTK